MIKLMVEVYSEQCGISSTIFDKDDSSISTENNPRALKKT